MSGQFQQLPSQLGVNGAYVSNQPTVLIMKEKFSFSGDDFTVKTVGGMDVVRVNGRAMSLSGRKEFYSPNGQHLFTLRKEHFSFPRSWYLEGPGGEKFLMLEGRFSFGKAKIDVKFKNLIAGGSDALLEVRGQLFDHSADITWNGLPVARIRREFFNMSEIFGGRQTYGVEVCPGVDLALMAAITVALDEQRNDR